MQNLNRQIEALQVEIRRRAGLNKKLDEVASSLAGRLRELEDERRECLMATAFGNGADGSWGGF